MADDYVTASDPMGVSSGEDRKPGIFFPLPGYLGKKLNLEKKGIYQTLSIFPSSGFFLNNNEKTLLFRKNPDDGQSPKTQYLCVLYTIVRTL
jgi:hypothetical protein